MADKIGMVSLGCPKNQVDAEIMLAKLEDAGYLLADDPYDADLVIVNTCGFIEDAKREAIDSILEMAELKGWYDPAPCGDRLPRAAISAGGTR